MGRHRFPDAARLAVTADAGGSNGYRIPAWEVHLPKLATETGLALRIRQRHDGADGLIAAEWPS
jgi:hypothetical protein